MNLRPTRAFGRFIKTQENGIKKTVHLLMNCSVLNKSSKRIMFSKTYTGCSISGLLKSGPI